MTGAFEWFADGSNWAGSGGVWARLFEHLWYTLLSVAIALVIALPVGAAIGHTGRGTAAVSGLANALRALPTLGLLIMLALWGLDTFRGSAALLVPAIIVLVVLAIPPILSNTYAGIAAVDPAARDAARGMGMTGAQVLRKVELPVALPLVFSGLRSAFLQVVATATIAAVISLGGFGRYVVDGLAQRDYGEMVAGALLVAVLAIIGDRILALIGYLVVSPGVSGRRVRARATTADLVVATGGGTGGATAGRTAGGTDGSGTRDDGPALVPAADVRGRSPDGRTS